MRKVLVLEDEIAIREFVVLNLRRSGYSVIEVRTGEDAIRYAKSDPDIDIAILDVMLPGINGVEVAKILRAEYPLMGIIMLTAKTQETDKVSAFMSGADDYITKPFSPSELIVRVDALFRRLSYARNESADLIKSGPFVLDNLSRTCSYNGKPLELSPIEFSILKLFIENPGTALTRDQILKAAWGKEIPSDEKTVDVSIRRLRIKINDSPSAPKYIGTVWGFGYKWIVKK